MQSMTLFVLHVLTVAFDTIKHGILLDSIGMGGTVCCSISPTLKAGFRVWYWVTAACPLALWPMEFHRVPYYPLCFFYSINVKPLGDDIKRSRLCFHQYEDDTHLYFMLPADSIEAVETMTRCVGVILGRMRVNKLQLNPNKTRC